MSYKRIAVFVLILLLFVPLLMPYASANAPEFPNHYTVYLHDLPEGAAYADLLIPLKDSDRHYSELEARNIPESFADDAEILSYYDSEGFRSYTFHYKEAESCIRIRFSKEPHVLFFTTVTAEDVIHYAPIEHDHSMDIGSRGKVKLAILDAQGNILHISDTLRVSNGNLFSEETHTYHYTVSDGEWVIKTYQNFFSKIFQWIFQVPGLILVNAALERLVAQFFKLSKYANLIFVTNLFTRFLMHLCFTIFYKMLPMFWLLTFLLEFLVYLIEYLTYRNAMKDVPKRKCFAYTVTANTATLFIGIALQLFFFPMP